MKPKVHFEDIQDEVAQIRKTHFALKDDSAFVLWFLRAFLADTEEDAVKALVGKSKDKGIDAIFFDPRAHLVHLIQGKFRYSLGDHTESRNDVLQLAALGELPERKKGELDAYYSKLDPLTRSKVEQLIHCVRRNGYGLCLYYVTTGRISSTIRNEAKQRARQAETSVDIYLLDAEQIKTIFSDYLTGHAPAVPSLPLPFASGGSVRSEGTIHRFDSEKKIESWVFSMAAKDIGEISSRVGVRLFARNVRGYLGEDTKINEAMAQTIKEEPDNFWYYNNGVTIVCDNAKREIQGGHDVLRVDRPQIINGQQTTRTLEGTSSGRASVLVRVIKIPRNHGDEDYYEDLVSAIVRATNWQNAIVPSDLISNDHMQVYLERELRKRGYQYLRKRQSRSEARRSWGSLNFRLIKKEDLAQAVAACDLDPVLVRKGKEGLFEERYYRSIFGSRSVPFYLSRYWLMNQVKYVARGRPERAYAKWLVLHMTWKLISQDISSGLGERRFRYIFEHSDATAYRAAGPLFSIIDAFFRSALAFYRVERGTGDEAKDVSTFFQLAKLHERFARFWGSAGNSNRAKVKRSHKKFRLALNAIELGD
jgi:hypothetical protein